MVTPSPALILPWTVVLTTSIALVGGRVAGFQVTGLAWVVPLSVALIILAGTRRPVTFPMLPWLAWGTYLGFHLLLTDYSALQRTVQLMCPVLIGAAVSTLQIDRAQLGRFLSGLRYLAGAILVLMVLKTGLLLTGTLPDRTGLAAEVMTAILLCVVFAASYAYGSTRSLRWWIALVIVPVVALTRTAIAVGWLTLPLTFASLRLQVRARLLLFALLAGVVLFNTERMQRKMFFSGRGSLSDLTSQDFATSGRFYMWNAFWERIPESIWVGHGTGAGEAFTRRITYGLSGYPHNDWLLYLYDHGIVGVFLLAVAIIMTAAAAYKRARSAHSPESRLLLISGASAFVPFVLLMGTDNISVYASFYGNLHFTLLGLGYAAMRLPHPPIPVRGAYEPLTPARALARSSA